MCVCVLRCCVTVLNFDVWDVYGWGVTVAYHNVVVLYVVILYRRVMLVPSVIVMVWWIMMYGGVLSVLW